jgi:hypothetical protein
MEVVFPTPCTRSLSLGTTLHLILPRRAILSTDRNFVCSRTAAGGEENVGSKEDIRGVDVAGGGFVDGDPRHRMRDDRRPLEVGVPSRREIVVLIEIDRLGRTRVARETGSRRCTTVEAGGDGALHVRVAGGICGATDP